MKKPGKDVAGDILRSLLSKGKNLEALEVAYQVQFDLDPAGVVERLLKLTGKPKPEEKASPKKPVGVSITLTGADEEKSQ